MDNTDKYYDIIDKYLNQELSPMESKNLENELTQNSNLKFQLDLQKESINMIKQYRYTTLKTRLDNINIGVTNPSMLQSTAAKVTAFVGGGAIILASVYFGLFNENNPENKTESDEAINLSLEQTKSTSITSNHNDLLVNTEEDSTPLKTTENSNSSLSAVDKTEHKQEKKSSEIKNTVAKTDKKDVKIIKDSMGHPIVIDNNESIDAPTSYESIDHHPHESTNNIHKSTAPSIEAPTNEKYNTVVADIRDNVNIMSDSKYKFHYQFKANNNLTLFGKFGTVYKIFKIVSRDGSENFYLRYKNNYYNLDVSMTTPTPLQKVSKTTLEVIQEHLSR